MIGIRKGWAIELVGTDLSLDKLLKFLPPSFDPWVESHQERRVEKVYLRSARWDGLPTPEEVEADAEALIVHINALLPIVEDWATPLRLGEVIRFDDAGKRAIVPGRTVLATRLKLTWDDPGEIPRFQKRLSRAQKDDDFAELLSYLATSTNWTVLYQAGEQLRSILGGERMAKNKLGSDFEELKRAMRTANHYRHSKKARHPLPSKPVTIEEGVEILRRLVANYL